jgi:hypothetical protein
MALYSSTSSGINSSNYNLEPSRGIIGSILSGAKKAFFGTLDILDRPRNALFTGIDYSMKNKDPFKGIASGFTGRERTEGGDILENMGVLDKGLRTVGGLALNIAGDPLTWTGAGVARNTINVGGKALKLGAIKSAASSFTDDFARVASKAPSAFSNVGRLDEAASMAAKASVYNAAKRGVKGVEDLGGLKFAGKTVVSPQQFGKLPGVSGMKSAFSALRSGLPDGSKFAGTAADTLTQKTSAIGDTVSSMFNTRPRLSGVDQKNFNVLYDAMDTARNAEGAMQTKTVEEVGSIARNIYDKLSQGQITPDELLDFTHVIEKQGAGLDTLNPALQELYNPIKNFADYINGQRKGLGKDVINEDGYSYLAHLFDPTASDKRVGLINKVFGGRKMLTEKGPQDIERTIYKFTGPDDVVKIGTANDLGLYRMDKDSKEFFDVYGNVFNQSEATIKEIKDAGMNIKSDIPEILATMGRRSSREQAAREFQKQASTILRFEKQPGMVQITSNDLPLLKGGWVRPEEKAWIEQGIKKFTDDEEIKAFVKAFDTASNTWKAWALFSPGYHTRNLVGNYFNNWVAGVSDPSLYQKARKFGAHIAKDADGKLRFIAGGNPEEIIEIAGKKAKVSEWMELFKKEGLISSNMFGNDLKSFFDDIVTQGKFMTIGDNNKLIKWNRLIGNELETNSKIAHVVGKMEKGMSLKDAVKSAKETLFDYGDLTNFERNVMKRVAPFYCVPDDTEILTTHGWKLRKDLSIGEPVLTYNIKSNESEWQPVLDIASFEYDDSLMTLSNKRGVKFKFTEDHRFPVFNYKNDISIIRAYEFNTGHKIPLSAKIIDTPVSILSPLEASLLGWLVTDGYHRWRGNNLEAMIYQSDKKYAKKIRKLFADYISSESVHPLTGVICFRLKTGTLNNIKKIFHSKADLPSIVTKLNREGLEAIFEAMMDAEGCWNLKGNQFTQKKGAVLDSFQIICNLLGKSFDIKEHKSNGCCYGYVRNRNTFCIKDATIGNESYSGIIWCPKTENSTWVMRQNGKVIITGNTWTRKNIPYQIQNAIKQPGKYTWIKKLSDESQDSFGEVESPYNSFSIPIAFNNKNGKVQYFDLQSFIPASDIARGAQPGETILSSLNPLIKTPLELASNHSFYTNSPIEEFPGESQNFMGIPTNKKVVTALKNIRPIAELDRLNIPFAPPPLGSYGVRPGELPFGARALRSTTGLRSYEYDPETTEQYQELDYNKTKSLINTQMRKAIDGEDWVMVKKLGKQLRDINAELSEKTLAKKKLSPKAREILNKLNL